MNPGNIMSRPKVSSEAQNELDKAQQQFDDFNNNVKAVTLDEGRQAPIQPTESSVQLSQKDIETMGDVYLKPQRSIGSIQKFNEKFRDEWDRRKKYVKFIAENKELIGDSIEMWTRPYGGVPAEYWVVPSNKPVWGPVYLADQIKSRRYVRYFMESVPTHTTGGMQFYGSMKVESQIQRMDANPVSSSKSFFMGR